MSEFAIKDSYKLEDIPLIVTLLRDPVNGCPWDKEQTHDSIRQNFIEETCEVVEAIDRKDTELLREELGDVLLQVMLHAEMERENGTFGIDDVADRLIKKLVLRHPHIFSDVTADTTDKVLSNWEDIKRLEKNQKTGSDAVNDVPRSLPSLMRSQKVQKRAGYVGFDYPDIDMAMGDLCSEVEELKAAIASGEGIEEEVGDLIFSAVNVARLSKLDAELACDKSCSKFAKRFGIVEKLAEQRGIDMKTCGIDKLNELWGQAKAQLSQQENKGDN